MGPNDFHAKDIKLEFSNGEQVDFTLDDTNEWQTIDLEGIGNDIITDYVSISVNSAYPIIYQNIGFSELTVFGYATGMSSGDFRYFPPLFYLMLNGFGCLLLILIIPFLRIQTFRKRQTLQRQRFHCST